VRQILREMENLIQPNAKIRVYNLGFAEGDYILIYQCFVNLISNAIKYSSKKEEPLIQIGSIENNEADIFYVKDNGAGFNMDYAHKLFGVFQRLHSEEEFEGTGVGLGIVQRIIAKHGGRVWAEGEIGKGATFYISLPKPNLQNEPE
jgi:light-regulated signal transduction histidine kinase (bacteriophytochrome)